MTPEVLAIVKRASAVAAAAGAVLAPIPLADEVVLVGLAGHMALAIGRCHGLPWQAIPWRPWGARALKGLAARAAVNLTVGAVPGLGALTNAATGAVLTLWLGASFEAACAAPPTEASAAPGGAGVRPRGS